MRQPEDRILAWLIAAVSLAFAVVLWPFSGAILWAVVLAVLFAPVDRRILAAMPGWRNAAALTTLLIIVVMVILPFTIVASMVFREAVSVYGSIQSGTLDLGIDVSGLRGILPDWLEGIVDRFGPDPATLRERLAALLVEIGQFVAGQAITIGQATFHLVVSAFVMLYLLYFLLRDGRDLARRIGDAVPLASDQRRALFGRFTIAIRAIVKGSVVVALVQGALGGAIFWALDIGAPVLWGALMGVFALVPLAGAGIAWVPVAIYLLATGAIWKGIVLIGVGVLVIGLVDNILRPILIGQDTRIPDYVVLISTLGGISIFGANGFVIGPVIAAMFVAAWAVFTTARQQREQRRTGPAA